MFKLSSRSLEKLEVNPLLVDTVKEAIKLSSVDFGVICKFPSRAGEVV